MWSDTQVGRSAAKYNNDNVVNLYVKTEKQEQESFSSAVGKVFPIYLLRAQYKVTDMENQYKVAHHIFGSFPGKSPKQGELISSEPKIQQHAKIRAGKTMTIAF